MDLFLPQSTLKSGQKIQISGSKSETNRLLLLQALSPLQIENASNSDDSAVMKQALHPPQNTVNIDHAGTAMRFLTAYFATKNGSKTLLTGSTRMKERPIGVLVDALRGLGADIQYTENEGFPPLKIKGKILHGGEVGVPANISSQYLSALILVGWKFRNGLRINLLGECTSRPYLLMTLALLKELGAEVSFENNIIEVRHAQGLANKTLWVESDWSSASYFYSMLAMSEIGTNIQLSTFKKESLQGDRILASIYEKFGVKTYFSENYITLTKENQPEVQNLHLNLSSAPDIAQTLAVTCLGLGIDCHLTGLHTLKIKETDRLSALKTELEKLGANVCISDQEIEVTPHTIKQNIAISTYQDHRMALAFAPLCLKTSLIIKQAEVVSKSYPNFWEDLRTLNIDYKQINP